MEAWRWVLAAVLGVLLVGAALLWLWPRSYEEGELRTVLPYRPEAICRTVQQVLAQYHYEITMANCSSAGGLLRATITFIPDKSGGFIPDKSGSFRNELSLSLQGLSEVGTMLSLNLRALRFDSATQSWREDPRAPLFLAGQDLLRLLARQL